MLVGAPPYSVNNANTHHLIPFNHLPFIYTHRPSVGRIVERITRKDEKVSFLFWLITWLLFCFYFYFVYMWEIKEIYHLCTNDKIIVNLDPKFIPAKTRKQLGRILCGTFGFVLNMNEHRTPWWLRPLFSYRKLDAPLYLLRSPFVLISLIQLIGTWKRPLKVKIYCPFFKSY